MKKFIEKYFTVIVFVFLVVMFFKSCGDNIELRKIRMELTSLKDSVSSKTEIKELNNNIVDMNNTIMGFMDSQSFILSNFMDVSIKNKSTNDAWNMYVKKINQLNKEKNK